MKQNPEVDYTSLAGTRTFKWVFQFCSEAQPTRGLNEGPIVIHPGIVAKLGIGFSDAH